MRIASEHPMASCKSAMNANVHFWYGLTVITSNGSHRPLQAPPQPRGVPSIPNASPQLDALRIEACSTVCSLYAWARYGLRESLRALVWTYGAKSGSAATEVDGALQPLSSELCTAHDPGCARRARHQLTEESHAVGSAPKWVTCKSEHFVTPPIHVHLQQAFCTDCYF